jgi:hypothetical protein
MVDVTKITDFLILYQWYKLSLSSCACVGAFVSFSATVVIGKLALRLLSNYVNEKVIIIIIIIIITGIFVV